MLPLVGIFGGTFDPPHSGHVALARACADHLGLKRVIWVPGGIPPHKLHSTLSAAEDRLAMARAAAAADPRFEVSEIELFRPGVSYTVDTLRELKARNPGHDLVLLIGDDQFRSLHRWREPHEIAALAQVATVPRAGKWGGDHPVPRPWPGGVTRVPLDPVDVSSRAVRAEYAATGRLNGIPSSVAKVIRKAGLYRLPTADGPLDLARLTAWGESLGFLMDPPHFLALSGRVGAGKSVLARAIGRGLGIGGPMPSPTFNLVHRHVMPDGGGLVHIDLYRVHSPDEVWELGWDELGSASEVVLVEWPERAERFLPRDHWRVELSVPEKRGAEFRRVRVLSVGSPRPLAGLGAVVQ